jgi:outer membrane protein OmpA-like peptidoglycan-associated protein
MRIRDLTLALSISVAGCSWFSEPQKYSVFFRPYSAEIDPEARVTIQSAASYGQTHGWLPIQVAGFSAPADPKLDVDGLSAQRAEAVKLLLVNDGVALYRIAVAANGVTDPQTLPSLAVRRVDISFGPPGSQGPAMTGPNTQ